MNKNMKRLNLQCWYDKREYTYLVPLGSNAKIRVACPYCYKKATIDLNPHRRPLRDIYKTTGDAETVMGEYYDFPPVIKTEPIEEPTS